MKNEHTSVSFNDNSDTSIMFDYQNITEETNGMVKVLTNPPTYIPPWRAIHTGNPWFNHNKIEPVCQNTGYEVQFSKQELRKGYFDVKHIQIPFGNIEEVIHGFYVMSKNSRVEPLARIKGWLEQLDTKYLTILSTVANLPNEIRDNPYELLNIVTTLALPCQQSGKLSCENRDTNIQTLPNENPAREYVLKFLEYMKEKDPNTHMISAWSARDYLLFTDMILYKLFVGGIDMTVIGTFSSPTNICLSGELLFWLMHLCNHRLAFFWKKMFQYDSNIDVPCGYNFESFCATISFKWQNILVQVLEYNKQYFPDNYLVKKIAKLELEDHGTWFSSESLFMCHISLLTGGHFREKNNKK